MRWRDCVQRAAEDTLRTGALALSQEHPDLQDMFLWAEFAEAAMIRSRERMNAQQEGLCREKMASQPVRHHEYVYGADLRYRSFFSQASGRAVEEGLVSASYDVRPPWPVGWRSMTNQAFALEFLRLGGYRSAMQTDEHGWTALHHAMQATVFWDMAHRVCQGLIEMMNPRWIRMKTWSGKLSGWSALHMACNGSDLMLERGNLVRLLIEHDADIIAVDPRAERLFCTRPAPESWTLLKLWQPQVAMWAASYDGRNAANRCSGSSGTMKRCS